MRAANLGEDICQKTDNCVHVKNDFKPYNAEIFLYKPWRPKGFFI